MLSVHHSWLPAPGPAGVRLSDPACRTRIDPVGRRSPSAVGDTGPAAKKAVRLELLAFTEPEIVEHALLELQQANP